MADGETADDFDALDQTARIERIWDILKDTEEPIAQEKLTSKTGRSAATVVATLEPC